MSKTAPTLTTSLVLQNWRGSRGGWYDTETGLDVGLFIEGFCPRHREALVKCEKDCDVPDAPVCHSCDEGPPEMGAHWRIKP